MGAIESSIYFFEDASVWLGLSLTIWRHSCFVLRNEVA